MSCPFRIISVEIGTKSNSRTELETKSKWFYTYGYMSYMDPFMFMVNTIEKSEYLAFSKSKVRNAVVFIYSLCNTITGLHLVSYLHNRFYQFLEQEREKMNLNAVSIY